MAWWWAFIFIGMPVVLFPFIVLISHKLEKMDERDRAKIMATWGRKPRV